MRELQGRWPGFRWGRWEVAGRSSVAGQGPYGRLRELRCAGWLESTRPGTPAGRRTCPQRKLRRKVPRVDGALTAQPRTPAVPPAAAHRRRRCSRRQPAQWRPASASCPPCCPALARRRGQVDGRRVPAGPGAGRGWPALATRRWSSKAMRIRPGLFCGSICWVLLVSGRVSVPKPLSQIQREPPPVSSRAVPKAVLRWIRAKAIGGDGGQLKTKAPAGSPRA